MLTEMATSRFSKVAIAADSCPEADCCLAESSQEFVPEAECTGWCQCCP